MHVNKIFNSIPQDAKFSRHQLELASESVKKHKVLVAHCRVVAAVTSTFLNIFSYALRGVSRFGVELSEGHPLKSVKVLTSDLCSSLRSVANTIAGIFYFIIGFLSFGKIYTYYPIPQKPIAKQVSNESPVKIDHSIAKPITTNNDEENTIKDLKESKVDLEDALKKNKEDSDDKINELKGEQENLIQDKDKEIEKLRAEKQQAINEKDTEIIEKEDQIDNLNQEIEKLKEEGEQHKEKIEKLTQAKDNEIKKLQKAHVKKNNEIKNKNDRIVELNQQIHNLQDAGILGNSNKRANTKSGKGNMIKVATEEEENFLKAILDSIKITKWNDVKYERRLGSIKDTVHGSFRQGFDVTKKDLDSRLIKEPENTLIIETIKILKALDSNEKFESVKKRHDTFVLSLQNAIVSEEFSRNKDPCIDLVIKVLSAWHNEMFPSPASPNNTRSRSALNEMLKLLKNN